MLQTHAVSYVSVDGDIDEFRSKPPIEPARTAPPTNPPAAGALRQLRILVLLLVLLAVSVGHLPGSAIAALAWREPLFVAIYPIAADDSPLTRAFVAELDAERFKPIDQFFMREALRYRSHSTNPSRPGSGGAERAPAAARGKLRHAGDGAVEPAAAILGLAGERAGAGAGGYSPVRAVPRSRDHAVGAAFARPQEGAASVWSTHLQRLR